MFVTAGGPIIIAATGFPKVFDLEVAVWFFDAMLLDRLCEEILHELFKLGVVLNDPLATCDLLRLCFFSMFLTLFGVEIF